MDWQGWFSLALAGGALLLMSTGRFAPHLVMMGVLVVLSVSGVLSPDQALAGFSNSGLMTVAAMFVVAAGVHHSGGVELLVTHLLRHPRSVRSAQARIAVPVSLLSGFLNNTPVVATMIPAIHSWSDRIGIAPSKLMIPLSYSAILGGTLTLVGTSTNLVVNGQYQRLTGAEGFSIFSITSVGLPVAVIGIAAILLVMPRLLPDHGPRIALSPTAGDGDALVSDIGAEPANAPERAWWSWAILLGMVVLAAVGTLSMLNAAFLGAALMILTGCCSPRQAQRAIDVPVLLTIGASFALGAALADTGAAGYLAERIMGLSHGHLLLSIFLVYFAVSVLTEVVTNNAAAVLVIPVVLSMTTVMGVAPEPFVIAVMMAASASFATPIGYQTNMMVLGPGGYRFSDFLRVGLPMNLFIGLVTVAVIAVVYGINPW
ncbi:SLC13 family permease [Marinobacter sp. C2H3]|uniref:SLC13 family permease n=1 Tax=Marinobacter sp. C2H3 TaxID=3119003 RepID=UPI00300EA6F4